jgi:hypothetical protein
MKIHRGPSLLFPRAYANVSHNMKLSAILTAVIFVLFIAGGICAQTHDGAAEKALVAGLSDDYYPAKWKTFEYADQGFKVRLPAKPTEEEGQKAEVIISAKNYQYHGVFSVTLNATKFTVDPEKLGIVDQVLKGGRDGAVASVQNDDPKVTEEKDVTLQGHPGKYLKVELKTGIVVRTKFVLAGSHLLVVAVSYAQPKPGGTPSAADIEKMTSAVLDSLQIL